MNSGWTAHDIRDAVVDFVRVWSEKTEIEAKAFQDWLEIGSSKFHDWRRRYGRVNEHNAWVPRDHWLEEWEKQAIVDYYSSHSLEGYRRLTFMMLDAGVVAASPSSVYRVLRKAGLLDRWNCKPSKKGTGFVQPLKPHEHWHIDIAYVNLGGTFYYLCSILDGYSRKIVHWQLGRSMTEGEIELIIQQAREKYPNCRPRIISDNGPQFIARDFKEFIRLVGMTHVRTSPYYPQSNGKLERYHRTLKSEWRMEGAGTENEARTVVEKYVEYYNDVRLHSAIGYVTPGSKMDGLEKEIFKRRDERLEAARAKRAEARASERRAE